MIGRLGETLDETPGNRDTATIGFCAVEQE